MKQIAKIAIIAGIAEIENLWPQSLAITRLPDSGNVQFSSNLQFSRI
jgi:hypothetical protein